MFSSLRNRAIAAFLLWAPLALIACPAVFAQSSASSAPAAPASAVAPVSASSPWLASLGQLFLDNVLVVTLVVIFLGAAITAIINTRRVDQVLKEFSGYPVHLILVNGLRIWGVLKVFSSGIELCYRAPHRNEQGNIKNSYILYTGEFDSIAAILRLDADLSPALRARRVEDLKGSHNPTLLSRSHRWTIKQLAILRDAYVKSLSVILGAAKKAAPGAGMIGTVITTQDQRLTEIGTTVLGAVNLAFDPILERYYGLWIIAEIKEEDRNREILGILKEYSPAWVEILEAAWPARVEAELRPDLDEQPIEEANCLIRWEEDAIVVVNHPPEAIELIELKISDEKRFLNNYRIEPGATYRISTPEFQGAPPPVRLTLRCFQPADLILPRTRSVIRHRGPMETQSWYEALGMKRKAPRRYRWTHSGEAEELSGSPYSEEKHSGGPDAGGL